MDGRNALSGDNSIQQKKTINGHESYANSLVMRSGSK